MSGLLFREAMAHASRFAGQEPRRVGKEWKTVCPHHETPGESSPSLDITEGKNGEALLICRSKGCKYCDITKAWGVEWQPERAADIFAGRPVRRRYAYLDAAGKLIATKIRFDDTNEPGRKCIWTPRLNGREMPLYRLPEVLAAVRDGAPVHVCEGEHDADALQELGLVATTSPHGAVTGDRTERKWTPSHTEALAVADVVLLQHADPPGAESVANIARSLHGKAKRIRVVQPLGEKKGYDVADFLTEHSREDLAAIVEATKAWTPKPEAGASETPALPSTTSETGPYRVSHGRLVYVKKLAGGTVEELQLCNFDARIIEDRSVDDGADTKRVFIVQGTLDDGTVLAPARVPASSFGGMRWVTQEWGTRAIVSAGSSSVDRCREGIQRLSGAPMRTTSYAHTGWGAINGESLFLHAGGAIGKDGGRHDVNVELTGSLSRAVLPDPGSEIADEGRKALEALFAVAPDKIVMPGLAAIGRAPLGEALVIDLVLFILGVTGTLKTAFAAVLQAFFGDFDERSLPGGWSSTANSLERQTFAAKDILLVIDDFAPHGGQREIQELHGKAERLIRAVGNHAGRGRLTSESTFRPTYAPRCMVVVTGEDIPRGHSVRARALIIEIDRGDVSPEKLSIAQRYALDGAFTRITSSYLKWLAPRISTLKTTLRARALELRAIAQGGIHRRAPDQVASLLLGLEQFIAFTVDARIYTTTEAEALLLRARRTLLGVAAAQAAHHAAADPARRFMALLVDALHAGKVHVADATTGTPPDDAERWGWRRTILAVPGATTDRLDPLGARIGWIDSTTQAVYLLVDVAYSEIQKIASSQGEPLTLQPRALSKALSERGLVLTRERTPQGERFTGKRDFPGAGRVRVLGLSLAAEKASHPTSESGANGASGAAEDQVPETQYVTPRPTQDEAAHPPHSGLGRTQVAPPHSAPPPHSGMGRKTGVGRPEPAPIEDSPRSPHSPHSGGEGGQVFPAQAERVA